MMLKAMLAAQNLPSRRGSMEKHAKTGAGARNNTPVHMAYFLCYPSMVKGASDKGWGALAGEGLVSRG